jgi:hypothetical protein
MGHMPRTQSIAVHNPASASAERSGRSARVTSGASAPNAAANSAWLTTSGSHAMAPNTTSQLSRKP